MSRKGRPNRCHQSHMPCNTGNKSISVMASRLRHGPCTHFIPTGAVCPETFNNNTCRANTGLRNNAIQPLHNQLHIGLFISICKPHGSLQYVSSKIFAKTCLIKLCGFPVSSEYFDLCDPHMLTTCKPRYHNLRINTHIDILFQNYHTFYYDVQRSVNDERFC